MGHACNGQLSSHPLRGKVEESAPQSHYYSSPTLLTFPANSALIKKSPIWKALTSSDWINTITLLNHGILRLFLHKGNYK